MFLNRQTIDVIRGAISQMNTAYATAAEKFPYVVLHVVTAVSRSVRMPNEKSEMKTRKCHPPMKVRVDPFVQMMIANRKQHKSKF